MIKQCPDRNNPDDPLGTAINKLSTAITIINFALFPLQKPQPDVIDPNSEEKPHSHAALIKNLRKCLGEQADKLRAIMHDIEGKVPPGLVGFFRGFQQQLRNKHQALNQFIGEQPQTIFLP